MHAGILVAVIGAVGAIIAAFVNRGRG
jgi:hypothetical protein